MKECLEEVDKEYLSDWHLYSRFPCGFFPFDFQKYVNENRLNNVADIDIDVNDGCGLVNYG